MNKLADLVIGDLIINPPIIQGGMGIRISASKLASAVANEGAMGVIAAAALGEDRPERNYVERSNLGLIDVITKAKELTSGPLGANLMYAMSNYDELVRVCLENKVDAIISGAGLPLRLPSLVKDSGIKLIPVVSSSRAADIIYRTWARKYDRVPDALIVEGPLAGGHLGFNFEELKNPDEFNIDRLLRDVLDVIKKYENLDNVRIPVIPAGGIFDGKDIARMLRQGASGVQIATRFVCTHECDAHVGYKEAYVKAKKENILIIHSPVGMPGRVIKNRFVERVLSGEKINFDCPYRCLKTCDPDKVNYCIADALINAYKGNFEEGFAMCGENTFRVDKIVSVKELINELVTETIEATRGR